MESSADTTEPDYSQQQASLTEVIPTILAANVSSDQWVRKGLVPGLVGDRPQQMGAVRSLARRRGQAWVGLERAREASHWMSPDQFGGSARETVSSEAEDPCRFVNFDQIESCLIDLWAVPGGQVKVAWLQRRLLLLCFEFLGVFDDVTAAGFELPAGELTAEYLRACFNITLVDCFHVNRSASYTKGSV